MRGTLSTRRRQVLSPREINYQNLLREKKTQKKSPGLEQFEDNKLKLDYGVLECTEGSKMIT